MNEKLPPHNLEAEESVLGSILIDSEQITVVDLTASDFFDESYAAIFDAMLNLHKRSGGIDQITVAHELHRQGKLESIGGAAYLSHLISITPSPFHAPYYAKVVKDSSINRKLIAAAGEIAQVAYENRDPQQALSDSQAILSAVAKSIPATQIWTPGDLATKAMGRYSKLRDSIPGIPTGFSGFDKRTGGLFNGDYIILASRPGVGKTTLALQVAKHAAENHNVLFASLEMLPEAVLDKLVASLVGRPARVIRRGGYSDELLDQITLSLGELSELKLYVCRGPQTTSSLRQLMERMKLNYGLDIAVVDYLQLLRDRYGSNPNERITFISGELANMAKEFSIALVVLSQLSRAPEGRSDKRPLLSDLRESGAIEQDADLVLLLYRESYYKRSMNPHGAETELLIDKDRMRGISGKFALYWDAKGEKYVGDKREITGSGQSERPAGQQVGLV